MPEPIAWSIIIVFWILGTYLLGNDSTHIFDDNSWKYRLLRGLAFQAFLAGIVGIFILFIIAIFTVSI